jgi:hypothetical protein
MAAAPGAPWDVLATLATPVPGTLPTAAGLELARPELARPEAALPEVAPPEVAPPELAWPGC